MIHNRRLRSDLFRASTVHTFETKEMRHEIDPQVKHALAPLGSDQIDSYLASTVAT